MISGSFEAIYVWTYGLPDWLKVWQPGASQPVDIKGGTSLWITSYYWNGGDSPFIGRVKATLIKPDSSSLVLTAYEGQDWAVTPGYGRAVGFGPIVFDLAGQYQLKCELQSIS